MHHIHNQPINHRAHDGIKAGGGFVEENDLGLCRNGPRKGHALLHAAGKLRWGKIAHRCGKANLRQHLGRPVARLRARDALLGQQLEADIFPDRQAIEQRAILKQHANAVIQCFTFAPWQLQNILPVNFNTAGIGFNQPQDAFDGDGFAGTRTAQNHHAMPGADIQIHAIQHLLRPKGF